MNEPVDPQGSVSATPSSAEASSITPAKSVRYKPMQMPSAPFWLILIAAIAFVAIVIAAWSVVFMFAVGLVLFAVLLPVVNWLERKGIRRGIGALLMVGLSVLVAIALGVLLFRVIFDQLLPFFANIPAYLAAMQQTAPPWLASLIEDILNAIHGAVSGIEPETIVLGFFTGVLGVVGTVLTWTLVPFFVFYMLVDEPRMAKGFQSGLPAPWKPYVNTSVRIFIDDFVRYFKAEVVVGLIQGTAVTIGVFIIGLIVGAPLSDYVILLGVIAGVMELLPQIGPIIALIPALILALATSPLAVVLVGGFYMVVFIIEANVLVPKIEGEVISFRPAVVLFLVAVGIGVGGIIGGILALPVSAIVRDLFSYVFHQMERQSLVEEEEEEQEALTASVAATVD
ncbi:MAG TPA: AI-2E family transporter [Candidatus Limnocylindrales bacterium]|nr:AI-2E family transporter [Candidatus Limnocylindrales bacterium]